MAALPPVVSGAVTGLADEWNRSVFVLAPGSPAKKTLAASVIPVVESSVPLALVSLTLSVLAPGLSPIERASLLVCALALAVLLAVINGLVTVCTTGFLRRVACAVAGLIITTTIASIPAALGHAPWAGFCALILLQSTVLGLTLAHQVSRQLRA